MAEETDSLGYPLAAQPHSDAYFDPMWRSRHGPKPMDGWRFAWRCKAGCEDCEGDMPATRHPDDLPECPDCGGSTERFNPDAEASR